MESRTIVAIEIGSSKVTGAVAEVLPTGGLNILTVESIYATDNVRHGRVQNIREVSSVVNDLIVRLENSPNVMPRKIKSAVLSLGGRSLCARRAQVTANFNHELEITDSTISRLLEQANRDYAGKNIIVATLPRTFYVNNAETRKPVGMYGSNIRGEFMHIVCAPENRQNLERLKFDNIDSQNIHYAVRPLAQAEILLSKDDIQVGCALVDVGAETTTISVYKDGSLCYLSTLPIGSRLITFDLVNGLVLTEEQAEHFKLELGTIDPEADLSAPNAEEVNNFVRARAGELIANIVHQIELSGFDASLLPSGIVILGGGARLPHFTKLLSSQSKMNVRPAEVPSFIRFSNIKDAGPANLDIIAILMAGAKNPNIEGLYLNEDTQDPEEEIIENKESEEINDIKSEDTVNSAVQEPAVDAEEQYVGSQTPSASTREVIPQEHKRYIPSGAVYNENDTTLLEDDADEEDEEKSNKPRKRSLFSLFGKKDKTPKEEPVAAPKESKNNDDNDDIEDDGENDDEYDDTPEELNIENSNNILDKVSGLVSNLADAIFKPKDSDELS